MSAYNSQNSIKDSIKSVLGQTYGNFEFLILDDGSSDDTEKIIKDYANKDKRIKFFKNNKNLHGHVWYRVFNEVPVILLVIIVYLVVFKPF